MQLWYNLNYLPTLLFSHGKFITIKKGPWIGIFVQKEYKEANLSN